ncbi:MAG: isoprenoid biosynthesis glyoxalase ElbB [Tepidisphaeraceae bacterium]|jgi:enhancing lycopene biosynthesis protein 2
MATRVGVVLSGCGVFDGSEIHEAVSVLIALDKRGAQLVCMAPNIAQAEVINHAARKPASGGRNVLEESARIARGNIRDMATVKADQLDALIFPGGFGAVKNLSTFASDGARMKVNPEVARLVGEMVKAGKPIGLACIAPVLAAAILGAQGLSPRLTIGTDKGTADAIRAMKATHVDTAAADICVDEANRVVTTPCYMTARGPWEVFQGAEKMVAEVLRMAEAK